VKAFQRLRALTPDTIWCLAGSLADGQVPRQELRRHHSRWEVWPWNPEQD